MTDRKQMTEQDIKALVANEIRSSIAYDDTELSKKRSTAIAYYEGRMTDTPSEVGRSSVVSRDVADTIGWMLPGIVRVFTASDEMAKCEPERPSDDEVTDQASDAINYVFLKDNDGYATLYNATHDSLLQGNGIVKHFWDDTEDSETSEHTGLSDDQLMLLAGEDDVEVLAHSEKFEESDGADEMGMPLPPVRTHDVKIKRTKSDGRIVVETIPPEQFLLDREARSIAEARFTGHKDRVPRSRLVEMGFNRKKVEGLSAGVDDQPEALERDSGFERRDGTADPSMTMVDLVECYVKADVDGDGIAETVRCYYAGNNSGGELLDWEVWDDVMPFTDIPCYPVPHRWAADSVADKTMDVQRIKTVLQRQALDNIYAANLPQRYVEGTLTNPDELYNPKFGGVIFGKPGTKVTDLSIPFIANHAFDAINYQDQVIERRTGVSRTTMALDPEALQNQTATANQNAHDAAYSQIELIARNQAEGWRKVFRAILRLMVKHQDKARTIRLRDKWVEIDPRSWNSDMDITINVGLGTGSRDRDMQMIQGIVMMQTNMLDRLQAAGLSDAALETLPLILNAAKKFTESAGMKTPEQFFPELGPEAIDALKQQLAQAKEGGDPVAAAKLAADNAKMEADEQRQERQFQFDAQKSEAQMQRDFQLQEMRIASDAQAREQEAMLKRETVAAELQLKREQLAAEIELKRELAMQDFGLRRELGHAGVAAKMSNATSGVHIGGEAG